MFWIESGSVGTVSAAPVTVRAAASTARSTGAGTGGCSRVLVVANNRLNSAASCSWAMRCSAGSTAGAPGPGTGTGTPARCALRIGRPRSPGSGGPSLGASLGTPE